MLQKILQVTCGQLIVEQSAIALPTARDQLRLCSDLHWLKIHFNSIQFKQFFKILSNVKYGLHWHLLAEHLDDGSEISNWRWLAMVSVFHWSAMGSRHGNYNFKCFSEDLV